MLGSIRKVKKKSDVKCHGVSCLKRTVDGILFLEYGKLRLNCRVEMGGVVWWEAGGPPKPK